MSGWLTHPAVAVVALVAGAFFGWSRGRKPTKVDLTIQFKKHKENDDDGTTR